MTASRPTPDELQALAEAVADVLQERGLVVASPSVSARVLDAGAAAELLGRDRQWVYAHADELGAFRHGDGRGRVSDSTHRRSSAGSVAAGDSKPSSRKPASRVVRNRTQAPF